MHHLLHHRTWQRQLKCNFYGMCCEGCCQLVCPDGTTRCCWCAQDPFDTSHDLGRTVDRQTCTFLRGEFERAARLLHEHAFPFQQLFEPSPTHNSE